MNLYKFVNITAGAHPNILSEVKLFTESAVPRIRFTDEHGNNIELFNSEKKVRAEYHGDTNLIDLPKDYKWYQILVYKTANYTAADIDTILNWKLAEKVTFVAAGKVHLQNEPFWKRLYELKATNPQMEKISYIRSWICVLRCAYIYAQSHATFVYPIEDVY